MIGYLQVSPVQLSGHVAYPSTSQIFMRTAVHKVLTAFQHEGTMFALQWFWSIVQKLKALLCADSMVGDELLRGKSNNVSNLQIMDE